MNISLLSFFGKQQRREEEKILKLKHSKPQYFCTTNFLWLFILARSFSRARNGVNGIFSYLFFVCGSRAKMFKVCGGIRPICAVLCMCSFFLGREFRDHFLGGVVVEYFLCV
jgi:hypothetical protein